MATRQKTAPGDEKPKSKELEGQFDPNDPADLYRYFISEFRASRNESNDDWTGIANFLERGNKIVKRYRASKKGSNRPNDARLNVFSANIQTQRAILVGQTPKCEVTRRFEDQDDDVARVAASILERVLNKGLEEDSKGFASFLAKCTEDRLLPGMCGGKVQFSAEFEDIPETPAQTREEPCPCVQPQPVAGPGLSIAGPPGLAPMAPPQPDPTCPECQGSGVVVRELAPAVPAHQKPTNESAEVVYWNWRDQMWSAARTFEEVTWWAFGADMSRKQLKAAFGDEEGGKIPLAAGAKAKGKSDRKETPWSRARVWEVWWKEERKVLYVVEGHPRVLFHVDNPTGEDPLGLEEFWPFEPPMMANATTDAYLPTADFDYAKDLYDEADELTARIRGIVRAIKAVGVYDKSSKALRRLLDEACELEMIPVESFAEFMAKGGFQGAFQLMPVGELVNTLQTLVAQRNLVIEGIYQITGLSDIIRGQQQQSETATTSAIKARYASVRLQDLQKDVARYATGFQRLRKEVIAKHWSIETIIERSAIMQSEDGKNPQLVLKAAQLIKDRHLDFRVVIKPEQISLQDWAQLKQQRGEVLTAVGGYFQSMMPLIQMSAQLGPQGVKATMKFALRNAQWLVAGMPGASALESSFDSFVAEVEKLSEAAAQQPQQPPPPDPKVMAAKIKAGGDLAKTQAANQGRMQEIAAETKADMLKRQHDAQMNVVEDQAKTEARLRLDAVRQVAAVTGGGMP